MVKIKFVFIILALIIFFQSCGQNAADKNELNIYSHRHYDADRELYRIFEEESGIKINVVNASADELINRLSVEGRYSPADILITVDAGRLYRAKNQNLLQSVASEVLERNIPENLRDPDGFWFGLTKRARVIIYSKEKVTAETIRNYEDLVKSEWKGKLVMRPSENIYNQSLLSSLIHHDGKEMAEDWVRGLVGNFARPPRGNDSDQIKAVASGEGELSLVNTYYLAKFLDSPVAEERDMASKIGVVFPNQENRGAHINVSGAGITRYSPNKQNALKFLEFLSGERAQRILADLNYEYPVHGNVQPAGILEQFGNFKEDTMNLSVLGNLNRDAVIIFDRAGWR